MVDLSALAAQDPSVAAALAAAGLTAAQHDAYRVAIVGAMLTQNVGRAAGAVDAASVLAQNVAFFRDDLLVRGGPRTTLMRMTP